MAVEIRAATYAALRAALAAGTYQAGQMVFCEGRAAAGDGGQGPGQIKFDAGGGFVDDGGVTIASADGRWAWVRVAVSAADPEHFEGADETARIQAALNYSAAVGLPLMIAEAYDCGELAAPSGAEIHIVFGPAGALTAAAADQTLLSPESHTTVEGGVFIGYMVGFDFDSVEEGARINFRDVRSVDCGLIGTAGGRVDFQAFINCRSTSANAIENIDIQGCRFQGGDFAICWRSPFERALISGNTFVGCERIGVMLGDNGGDQKLFKRIEVCGNRIVDIVSTDSSEYEIHGVLCYGQVVDVTDNHVDTVADVHASTHDSEALYIKAMMGRIERNTVIDGGRGDASITVKGVVTASEFDAISAGTAYSKDIRVCGNIIANRASWVSSYGAQTSGIYTAGSRIVVGDNKIFGSYDKVISAGGETDLLSNQIDGSFTNGILVSISDSNSAQCRAVRIDENKILQRNSAGASAFEIRVSTLAAISIPFVEITNNLSQQIGSGAYSSGPQAHFNVRVDRLGVGNNEVSRLVTSKNTIIGVSSSEANAFVVQTTAGSGANGGIVSSWISKDNEVNHVTNVYRTVLQSAGDIVFARVDGGHLENVQGRLLSNFTDITSAKVRNVTGTRPSESAGTASITSGNTSVTVTMGLQDTLRPASLANLMAVPHTSLGSATNWWISSLSADTFTINLDTDPGATVTFGWRATNLYYN